MNYVDERGKMNHKDMNENIDKNRDTNRAKSKKQNSDMWRYLSRNKQEIGKTHTLKVIDQVSIGQSKKKVKDTNNHSRIAKLPSANCKGLYNPSLSLHQVGDHMQGLLQHLQGA